jgi:hypothetical protein
VYEVCFFWRMLRVALTFVKYFKSLHSHTVEVGGGGDSPGNRK